VLAFWNDSVSWKSVGSQLLLGAPLRGESNYIPQGWTLQLELILSFLVPVLVLCARQATKWLLVYLVVLIAVFKLPLFLAHFALGVLVAKYAKSFSESGVSKSPLRLALVLLGGLLLYTYRFTLPVYLGALGLGRVAGVLSKDSVIWLATGVGSALILLVVLNSNRLQGILKAPVLAYVGKVSYSIYLSHLVVLLAVVPPIMRKVDGWGFGLPMLNAGAGFVTLILGTILLASVLYYTIEVPFIRLGKWAVGRRG